MPKQIIDYSKTIIYKLRHITDINDEDIYVGHTTNFSKRKTKHKTDCNNPNGEPYNTKKYIEIRSKGGWEEWEMLPIELYPCSNKIEAVIREEYWRKDFNAKLNTLKAHTTEEERKEALKAFAKDYNPVYYQENKEDEHFIKVRQNWYERNRDDILVKNKINYEENKEEILAGQKVYYEANKEEISAQGKEKLTCECGCIIARNNMSEHRQSKKHIDLMNNVFTEQQEKSTCECGCLIRKRDLTRHRKTKKHLDLMK